MLKPEKLNALSHKLGHDFRDSTPLMTALTHRSFIHERPSHVYPTNERMEFLGDAVLALVVAEELFTRHAELPEGQLSKLRSYAVNEDTLATIARHLNLGSFMFLGRGEEKQEKDTILADGMEAVIAAIYQDGGLVAVKAAWARWQKEMNIDLLAPRNLEDFDAICARERCLYAAVGVATNDEVLVLEASDGSRPIDLPMSVLFGKAPKMHRDTAHVATTRWPKLDTAALDLN
jgi:dsRNA-specific ribonuclease